MKSKLNSILLIDDDEPTNIFTSIILEDAGCTNHIKVAYGGQEALSYLSDCKQRNKNHCPPDLIFLDINMPAMNGWEFLDEYKKLKEDTKGKIIIIMLTTSLSPDDKAKANEIAEISGFETKPLTEEKLNKILNQHFQNCLEKSSE